MMYDHYSYSDVLYIIEIDCKYLRELTEDGQLRQQIRRCICILTLFYIPLMVFGSVMQSIYQALLPLSPFCWTQEDIYSLSQLCTTHHCMNNGHTSCQLLIIAHLLFCSFVLLIVGLTSMEPIFPGQFFQGIGHLLVDIKQILERRKDLVSFLIIYLLLLGFFHISLLVWKDVPFSVVSYLLLFVVLFLARWFLTNPNHQSIIDVFLLFTTFLGASTLLSLLQGHVYSRSQWFLHIHAHAVGINSLFFLCHGFVDKLISMYRIWSRTPQGDYTIHNFVSGSENDVKTPISLVQS